MWLIKRSWFRFSELWLFHDHLFVIDIVKFSNRSIHNLFNVDKGTCMDSHKLFKLSVTRYKQKSEIFLLPDYRLPKYMADVFGLYESMKK